MLSIAMGGSQPAMGTSPPMGYAGMQPMVRLFLMGEPESLPRMAVRAGWWSLPGWDVAAFCVHLGPALPKGISTAKKLFIAAKHFHKGTDLKALYFVHVRFAMKNAQTELLRAHSLEARVPAPAAAAVMASLSSCAHFSQRTSSGCWNPLFARCCR